MKKRAVLKIFGLVQGVSFRIFIRNSAQKLGVTGWVKNESDGTVKIVAEGNEDDLKKLIDLCYNGPIFARVGDLKTDWQEATGEFEGFEIKY